MKPLILIFLFCLVLPVWGQEEAGGEDDVKAKIRRLRQEQVQAVKVQDYERAKILKKIIKELKSGNDVDVEGLVEGDEDPDIDKARLLKYDKALAKKSGDRVRTELNREQQNEFVARGLLIDAKKKIIEGNYTFAEKMLGDALDLRGDDQDIIYYYKLLKFPKANVISGKSIYSLLKKEAVVFGLHYSDNPEGHPEWLKNWQLKVRSEGGTVVRTWEGEGVLEPEISWDTKDDKGKVVKEGKYSTVLELNGPYFTRFQTEELRFELMAKPPAVQIRLKQKIFLAGEDKVEIEIMAEDDSVLKSWEIIIKNQEGTEINRLSGEKFNTSVSWDGSKENGELVSEGDTITLSSHYLDSLDKKWEGNSEELFSDIKIINNKIVLNNIQFESGKSKLRGPSLDILDKVVGLLKDRIWLDIQIDGHTDSVGDEDYNQKLSADRARAVVSYFIRKGIAKTRLTHKGFGETVPIASNDTDEGKAKNRRVEFNLVENKEKLDAYYRQKRDEARQKNKK